MNTTHSPGDTVTLHEVPAPLRGLAGTVERVDAHTIVVFVDQPDKGHDLRLTLRPEQVTR